MSCFTSMRQYEVTYTAAVGDGSVLMILVVPMPSSIWLNVYEAF